MQTPHHIESGLNDLSLFPEEPKRKNSVCRSFSSLIPHRDSSLGLYHSSSSSSTMIGDYIGMESCVDVLSDGDQLELLDRSHTAAASTGKREIRHRRTSSAAAEGSGRRCRWEFPPPIPSLAQTENLQSRMPWVLKRHYTGDGRLILTEEKVRHHEYLRAHRSNGRLTLHLVPFDGAVLAPPLADPRDEENVTEKECNNIADDLNELDQEEQEECDGGGDNDRDCDCDEVDGGDEDDQVEEECGTDDKNGKEGIGSGGKCYNYSGGRCILGVPMPAIRPVHS